MRSIQKKILPSLALVTLSFGAFSQTGTVQPTIHKIDPSATKSGGHASEQKIQPREEKSIHSAEIDKKNNKATILVKDEKGIITKKEVYELKQEKK